MAHQLKRSPRRAARFSSATTCNSCADGLSVSARAFSRTAPDAASNAIKSASRLRASAKTSGMAKRGSAVGCPVSKHPTWAVPDCRWQALCLAFDQAFRGPMMAGLGEDPGVTPSRAVRYAERECDGCGILLPANEMVRTNQRVLAGVTKRTRYYSSTRGTFGSGGGTSERYRVETIDLCPSCFDLRRSAPGPSVGKFLFYGAGALVAIWLISAVLGGRQASNESDPVSTSSAVPVQVGSDLNGTTPVSMASAPVPNDETLAATETQGTLPSADPDLAEPPAPAATASYAVQAAPVTQSAQPATAPARGCSGTSPSLSAMICGSPSLRDQDARINSIFRTLVARAAPDERSSFMQEQGDWITERNACTSQDCLQGSYGKRLRAVTAQAWTQYNRQRAPSSGQ